MLNAYLDAYRGLPASVWKISIVLLINRSGTMVLPFWALYCTSERDLSIGQAGGLLAVHGIGGIFGSMLGGWLASTVGPVRVMIGSLAFSCIGFLVLMWPTTLVGMAAAMFALSLATESMRPAAATATADCCDPALHPRAMGLNRLAINLGMALGATVGGFVATVSFRFLFYFDSVTCGLAALASVYLLRDITLHHEDRTGGGGVTRWEVLQDGPFWIMLATMFGTALVFFQLLGTYVLYLRDSYQLDEFQIGVLMGVNTVVIVFSEMVLLKLVEGFNRLRVVACGCFCACVGFGIIQFGNSMAFAVVSVLVWTLGEMLTAPLTAAWITSRASPANRGRYLGMYTSCFSVAAVAAPIWGTWMYNRGTDGLWNSCLALGVLTFALPWLLSRMFSSTPSSAVVETHRAS